MSEINYESVNIDAKVLEEQNENLKKPKESLQNTQKISFDPKNYLDLRLKDHEATKTVKVRFLPISASDSTVFFDITTHALKVDKEIAKSGFKSYVCLNDEKVGSKEECPICKKSKELFDKSAKARQEGNEALSKSLFKEACSLKKKRTFITRVIDRDHEEEGVKFWRFNENSKGEGIYDKLMSLYNTRKQESLDEDKGEYNIFDLYEGKDIIINVSKSQIPDGFGGMKNTIACNITDSGNSKPLSKDIEKANCWLNDEKTWKDVYSNKTAGYLELVVNGKIPVYNKELKKYVEKTENDVQQKKIEKEVANENLKANYVPSEKNINKIVNNEESKGIDTKNDLPF